MHDVGALLVKNMVRTRFQYVEKQDYAGETVDAP